MSQTLVAQSFAIPRYLTEAGVRRYGFHGLSYESIVSRFRELSPVVASSRLLIARLGNGASLCAVKNGRAILDPERNGTGERKISAATSRVSVWVVPTDEERMIVRHIMAVLARDSL